MICLSVSKLCRVREIRWTYYVWWLSRGQNLLSCFYLLTSWESFNKSWICRFSLLVHTDGKFPYNWDIWICGTCPSDIFRLTQSISFVILSMVIFACLRLPCASAILYKFSTLVFQLQLVKCHLLLEPLAQSSLGVGRFWIFKLLFFHFHWFLSLLNLEIDPNVCCYRKA